MEKASPCSYLSLKEAGLNHFQLSVGHIGFVKEFFIDILGTEERVNTLTTFLYEKNYVGYREHVKAVTAYHRLINNVCSIS